MPSILLASTSRMDLAKAGAVSRGLLCLAAIAALFALSACGKSDFSALVLKPELVAQWQALDATQRAIGDRVKPSDWSAGVFIGSSQLAGILKQLIGYKLQNVADTDWLKDSTLIVQSLKLTPAIGYARTEVMLRAQKGELQLDLKLIANVSFQGVRQSDEADRVVAAYFRIEPLEIQPQVKLGLFHSGSKEFWAKLAPQLAVAFLDPHLFEIPVPIQDVHEIPLGIDQQDTKVVNQKTKATITYQITLPETKLDEHLSFSAPIFRPEGISLLARSAADGQQLLSPGKPPTQSTEELQKQVSTLKAEIDKKTAAFTGKEDEMTVWLARAVFEEMIQRIGSLREDQRQVKIQTIKYTGQLAGERWHDNFLGDGGYYAELANAQNAYAIITLGTPQVQWSASAMTFSLPVDALVNADVKVNFDPLIGGGAGTSLGINGSASGTLRATTTPAIVASDDVKVAALNTTLSCDAVTAQVADDGRLKIDLGWISVPKVGMKMTMPLGAFQVGPITLLDDGPILVEMPARDPRQEEDETVKRELIKKNPWAVIPPVAALKLRVIPKTVTQDESGYAISVAFDSQPLNTQGTKTALEDARKAVRTEADAHKEKVSELLKSQKPSTTCSGGTTIAVLLGPVEIGPHNDVVKFVREVLQDVTTTLDPTSALGKAVEVAKKNGIPLPSVPPGVLPVLVSPIPGSPIPLPPIPVPSIPRIPVPPIHVSVGPVKF